MQSYQQRQRVLFFGSIGSGKSTILNAAVGESVAYANDEPFGVTEEFEEY